MVLERLCRVCDSGSDYGRGPASTTAMTMTAMATVPTSEWARRWRLLVVVEAVSSGGGGGGGGDVDRVGGVMQ